MVKAIRAVSLKTVVLTVSACIGAIFIYVGSVYGMAALPGFLLLFVVLAFAVWILTVASPH